jgi:cytochrome P450 family 26 subfamily A
MKKLAFGIACEALIGRRDPRDHAALLPPFTTMLKGLFQIPLNLPGTRYRDALLASRAIRKQLRTWIDEARARDVDRPQLVDDRNESQDSREEEEEEEEDDDDADNVLLGLLRFADELGLPLSDDCIADNLLLLLFAGHDTSSSVATLACKFLAAHPALMDAVHAGLIDPSMIVSSS